MGSAPRRPRQPPSSSVAAAIATHFDGDASLYEEFAAACRAQFPHDIAAGRAACEAGDLRELQRLAHNLKSALLMLGEAAISDLAAALEAGAATGTPALASARWRALESALAPLRPK